MNEVAAARSGESVARTGEFMLQDIREAVVIFNPSAGRARALSRSLERARHILARQGIETELSLTTGPGAATEIARKAVRDQRQLVIACGGDGTLNEVVNGMAHSQVPLALLPAGTANVLAKEIGLPWNVEQASRLITGSSPRRIALGLATTTANGDRGRFFLSVAGAGPDGAIVNAVNLKLKARIGVLAYWAAGFQQLSRNFAQFRVTVGSKVLDATLIVVGRTKSYGGPFRITTEADLYRDEFELLICTTRSA